MLVFGVGQGRGTLLYVTKVEGGRYLLLRERILRSRYPYTNHSG